MYLFPYSAHVMIYGVKAYVNLSIPASKSVLKIISSPLQREEDSDQVYLSLYSGESAALGITSDYRCHTDPGVHSHNYP